jgi:hypothetical protein
MVAAVTITMGLRTNLSRRDNSDSKGAWEEEGQEEEKGEEEVDDDDNDEEEEGEERCGY